ncbi:putative Mg(2+) transport ATPase [Clostridium homopropionicum DSM 5847]|uniref:Putative Mg(2+) transport ATPase n=1 Tax=Clostridium homopropionicum DSM 5847 TaxID=1121318 RepID=A0A0L6Z7I7_9CLOT|nr:MgtC/SapB family protein [Clostridium homopropionicum]KOA18930.1 putative Mg(2+) transport ATPase [Clostridium homopropionicum DSM 5847]SFG44190.1 putative Mg2+ transporter-C (MgtC) family protein [Clostridium homopropionicum]
MSNYEILFKICTAILIGGIIGYERESKNRPAGLRTHILVCVGAAVVSIIQLKIIEDTLSFVTRYPKLTGMLGSDMGRLGAQVISGVGFLGVGTIIRTRGSVKGLTTAASIWVTACIGLAVGLGYYFVSFTATIGVFVVVVCMKRIEENFFDKIKLITIEIQYYNKGNLNSDVCRYFWNKHLKIEDVCYAIGKDESRDLFKKCYYTVLVTKHTNLDKIQSDLNKFHQIVKATITE